MRWLNVTYPWTGGIPVYAGLLSLADEKLYTKVWEFAEKWAAESDHASLRVALELYRVICTDEDENGEPKTFGWRLLKIDEIRAAAYSKIADTLIRREILLGVAKWNVRTLALGVADEDEDCRKIAASKIPRPLPSKSLKERLVGSVSDPPWQWRTVSRALLVAALLFMLSRASSDFEKSVLIALALIYVSFSNAYLWAEEKAMVFAARQHEQISRIRSLTGGELPSEQNSLLARGEAAAQALHDRALVDSIFSATLMVICVGQLILMAL